MFKCFPKTYDGNQFRFEFDYEEEMAAFQKVVIKIRKLYDAHKDHEKPLPFETEFRTNRDSVDVLESKRLFDTDLEFEVAKERHQDLRKMFPNFFCLNVISKNCFVISFHDPSEA
jgi:hypothetical protein